MKGKLVFNSLNIAVCSVILYGCGGGGGDSSGSGTSSKVEREMVEVLSTRPDLIIDSDVLLKLDLPDDIQTTALKVSLNGQNISDAFANEQRQALVEGLKLGDNQLKVEAGRYYQHLSLINHPSSGPLLSGPQLKPWTCTNASTDQFCQKAVQYNYYYKDRLGLIKSYDLAQPPASQNIATTTTDEGLTVPFIVREEVGYQNRDEYRFAVLYNPNQPWTALKPQAQFNHKLVVTHGQSCGNDYQSASAPTVIATSSSILPDVTILALGRGFGVMSTALSHSGHNCNLAIQAESLIMAKERFIEQHGSLRYTIGQGCSGGALAAQWVANAYPGIYQGILPTCSFPDAWSTASQFADYHLMINYF